MDEKDNQELLSIIKSMQEGEIEGVEQRIESLRKKYPQDATVIAVYGEFLFLTQNYKKYIEIFSNFIDLDCEIVDAVFKLGLAYLKEEIFKDAERFLNKAVELNHRHPGLFEAITDLQSIKGIITAYERQKSDPWYLLAAAKVFRKFGLKKHSKKFMAEVKENFPNIFQLDYLSCELEMLELMDNKEENKLNDLIKEYSIKNPNIAVIPHHHNFFAPRNNFTKEITR